MKKVTLFFKQLFTRLRASTPPFFRVIQWIAATAAFITGLPTILQAEGVVLPEYLTFLVSKAAMWSSIVALVIARLPTNDQTVVYKFKQQQTPEQREKTIEKLNDNTQP